MISKLGLCRFYLCKQKHEEKMIKRRFYKLEHGDKDSGSDSSCFSSDSDPETEESEESEEEDSVAEVSEDDDDSGDDETPGLFLQLSHYVF